jgi:hypothetical protein
VQSLLLPGWLLPFWNPESLSPTDGTRERAGLSTVVSIGTLWNWTERTLVVSTPIQNRPIPVGSRRRHVVRLAQPFSPFATTGGALTMPDSPRHLRRPRVEGAADYDGMYQSRHRHPAAQCPRLD